MDLRDNTQTNLEMGNAEIIHISGAAPREMWELLMITVR